VINHSGSYCSVYSLGWNDFYRLSEQSICNSWAAEVDSYTQLQLCTFSFMYFIPVIWRWPFEIKTCCHIKDVTYISCVDGILFLLINIMDTLREYLLSVVHTSPLCIGPPIIPQKHKGSLDCVQTALKTGFNFINLV
jgi:hypothetical protein